MTARERMDDPPLTALWRRASEVMRNEVGERPFKTWIWPIVPVSANEETIVLACTTDFEAERVASRFGEKIANVLARLSGMERAVDFVVLPKPQLLHAAEATTEAAPALVEGSIPLDPKSTFAAFVIGPSNAAAFNAAQNVAAGTATRANPLFIFGPTGTGKTHLLQAAAARMLERDPKLRVLYLTSEAFVRGFVTSLKDRKTLAFKDLVRNVDVLFCDDVQFLEGKAASVEEFFFTFDDLIARGKQIVLSADRSPSLIEQLPERLRSRLINGGGVEITLADLDLRFAILQAKAKRLTQEAPGFSVGDDVLRMMAARIQANVRVLDGALRRLAMQSSNTEAITFECAQIWLADFLKAHNKRVTLSEIGQGVAQHFGVTPRDLLSSCRRREYVRPRQVAFFVSRQLTNRSFPEIGRHYGKDHTTVMHGCDQVRRRCATDPTFKAEVETIQRSIRDWEDQGDKNNKN